MQENVLGTFKIIRGFADLHDLTEVSVAMPYQGSKNSPGSGYQRQLDEQQPIFPNTACRSRRERKDYEENIKS